MIDTVAATMGYDWDRAFKMGVLEMLNVAAYCKDKAENEKQKLEQWKMKN